MLTSIQRETRSTSMICIRTLIAHVAIHRLSNSKKKSIVFANNNYCFSPQMKDIETLGVVDERGQPKEPMYKLGSIHEKGDNFYSYDLTFKSFRSEY